MNTIIPLIEQKQRIRISETEFLKESLSFLENHNDKNRAGLDTIKEMKLKLNHIEILTHEILLLENLLEVSK